MHSKINSRKKIGLKQNIKEYWGTIYHNTILARPMLERHMGVKNAKANINKKSLSCSLVNTIKNNNPKAPKKSNKNRKYNNNIFKNRNNRFKRLALLGRCPSR